MTRPVAALVLVAALTACADDGADAPGAAPTTAPPAAITEPPATAAPSTNPATGGLPPELTVSVEYVPNLAVLRRLEVKIANDGTVPVDVAALSYRSPWVEPGPPWRGVALVGPGLVRDHGLELGAASCPPSDDGAGESAVDITITAGERSWSASYPIPDPERLEQLNARECGQRAVLDVVDIAFDDDPEIDGQVLTTAIDITRRDRRDPVTVTQVDGSILFQLKPDGPDGELATLDPDTEQASIPLEVRNTRCDAHAVSQSQLSYRFPVFVRVGDAEPAYLFIEPGPGLRAGLEALVQECIQREGSGIPTG